MAITDAERETLKTSHAGIEVADGVYRFGADLVNWYLLVDDGELTLIDAGLPNHWELLQEGLDSLGYALTDIKALILTHVDGDHNGFAERLRSHGVPVWIHVDDHDDVLAGGRDPLARPLLYLWRPAFFRFFLNLMRKGFMSVEGVKEAKTFEDGQELDVPGSPTAVHTPGHTAGHTAFWIPDRHVLFSGDSLITIDPTTWKECDPRVVKITDADVEQAKLSAQRLVEFDDVTLLPGHGRPWTGNLRDTLAPRRS